MTKAEMLARMSSRELSEQMAYDTWLDEERQAAAAETERDRAPDDERAPRRGHRTKPQRISLVFPDARRS
jgi:hypothetical protein